MHQPHNFKIPGLSNLHQRPQHPAGSYKGCPEAGNTIVYIMGVIYVNFKSDRIKDFGNNNSAALSDAPFYSSPQLFGYFQCATFSSTFPRNHILHYSQGLHVPTSSKKQKSLGRNLLNFLPNHLQMFYICVCAPFSLSLLLSLPYKNIASYFKFFPKLISLHCIPPS